VRERKLSKRRWYNVKASVLRAISSKCQAGQRARGGGSKKFGDIQEKDKGRENFKKTNEIKIYIRRH